MFSKSSKYLNPEVLITDTATDGWTMEQERTGQISFFDASLPQKVETNTVEEDLLLKCKALDSEYVYKGLKEIKTQKDIEDLEEVSGGFHDAYIAKLEKDENKNLHVLFKGVWGCSIEFIFSDYVTYHVYVDDLYNDYWFESCMCFDSRGFFCLNDEEYPLDEKEKPERDMYHTWFKAKKAEYRVIL